MLGCFPYKDKLFVIKPIGNKTMRTIEVKLEFMTMRELHKDLTDRGFSVVKGRYMTDNQYASINYIAGKYKVRIGRVYG